MKFFTTKALLLWMILAATTAFGQSSNVTFQVDMSRYTSLGATDTVYVNGTWNSWCGKCNPLTKPATGNVWTGTFLIPNGAQEFKYTINGWSAQENLTTGSPCTVTNSGFTNRSITVTAAVTLPLVCWESCTTCATLQPMDLPVTFDSTNVNYILADFGGNASVITASPTNANNKVAKVTKPLGAETWAGTTMGGSAGFATAIPFSSNANKMRMKVYSPDSGVVVRLKVEDPNDGTRSCETDAITTVANAWQTLEFNFASQASGTAAINYSYTYKKASVFFNFGVSGNTAGAKIYYFDDVQFVPATGPVLQPMRLPVNFDSSNVNYVLTDFGGNAATVITDPGNSNNKLARVIKSNTAELWAGTTIGTSAGLADPIPFAAGATKMRVRVYSPDSGIVVKLKAEVAGDPTKSVETDTRTTHANSWETLEFDFANQSSGTAAINYTYTYKMLSIFFNFGVTGASAGTKTYMFDDVAFGGASQPAPSKVNVRFSVNVKNIPMNAGDTVTLNGTFNNWCGACTKLNKLPGTDVWTGVVQLDTNTEYEYKFTIGNWSKQENLAAGLPCTKTTGSFTNRVYRTSKTNDSLPVVCWESCGSCTSGGPVKTMVTFQVDMSKRGLAAGDTVTLNGTFNNWCGKCNPMTQVGTSKIWQTSILLDKDSSYDFKYTIGNWAAQEILKEGLPCTTTKSGFTNRTIVVNKLNDTLPLVCWESCTDCKNTAPKANVTFKVNMKSYVGDYSKGVTINGNFNGWCGDCTRLDSMGNYIYGITLSLDTGEYEFKYTIGNWDDQEQFTPGDPCTKTTGTFTNRVVRIADTNAVMVGAYCWNTCSLCNPMSVEEVILNKLILFPNPAQDRLWIDFGMPVRSKVKVEIFDLQGRLTGIHENNDTQTMELSTAALTPGLYLVKVEINQVVKTYKVTIR